MRAKFENGNRLGEAGKATRFKKGQSGNPAGMPKEALELRALLKGDAATVHAALMKLVRKGHPTVTIYAHRQLVGEPPSKVEVEVSNKNGQPFRTSVNLQALSTAELVQLEALMLKAQGRDEKVINMLPEKTG